MDCDSGGVSNAHECARVPSSDPFDIADDDDTVDCTTGNGTTTIKAISPTQRVGNQNRTSDNKPTQKKDDVKRNEDATKEEGTDSNDNKSDNK